MAVRGNDLMRTNMVFSIAAMKAALVFVICVLHISTAVSIGPDTTICNPSDYINLNKGPAKPVLPSQWSVRIEANHLGDNYTLDVKESYDGIHNRGALHGYMHGKKFKQIFLYNSSEILTLSYPTQGKAAKCQVEDLAKSGESDIFGLTRSADGSEQMFSANNALRFGGKHPEKYLGRGSARDGIIVDSWESCIYLPSKNSTMKITWHFSANGTWTTASNLVVPVEMEMVGSKAGTPINRVYIFTGFRPQIYYGAVDKFETPSGTVCPNRAVTRPIPTITDMFTFSSEKVTSNYISVIREYYDFDLNLVRYDHNQLFRVHDFNTGVAYILDSMLGNCTVTPISKTGLDAKSGSGGSARIRTKKEFFYMDGSKFVYAGQRVVRGITCDVFQTVRSDYPSGNPGNSRTIWEWYFASKEWIESVGLKYEFSLPIKFEVLSDDMQLDLVYNVYEYSEGRPDIWKTDISACYNYTQVKVYQITFPAKYKNVVGANLGVFNLNMMQTIVDLSAVSPLRVNRIQVNFLSNSLLVSWTLLDKAPIKGDAVNTSFIDLPLAEADQLISTAIDKGNFQVILDPATFPNLPKGPMVAKRYTDTSKVTYVTKQFRMGSSGGGSVGYNGGAMGGLAVGMIVLGCVLGFLVVFLIYRKGGGAFTNSFTPKHFDKDME